VRRSAQKAALERPTHEREQAGQLTDAVHGHFAADVGVVVGGIALDRLGYWKLVRDGAPEGGVAEAVRARITFLGPGL
jgi:hypothetical protein